MRDSGRQGQHCIFFESVLAENLRTGPPPLMNITSRFKALAARGFARKTAAEPLSRRLLQPWESSLLCLQNDPETIVGQAAAMAKGMRRHLPGQLSKTDLLGQS